MGGPGAHDVLTEKEKLLLVGKLQCLNMFLSPYTESKYLIFFLAKENKQDEKP